MDHQYLSGTCNRHARRYCLLRRGTRGLAASWLFGPRRKALTLLERQMACRAMPNVRANLRAEADDAWPRKA
jgi:hypothetical protein